MYVLHTYIYIYIHTYIHTYYTYEYRQISDMSHELLSLECVLLLECVLILECVHRYRQVSDMSLSHLEFIEEPALLAAQRGTNSGKSAP
jgi:hypothetical protein